MPHAPSPARLSSLSTSLLTSLVELSRLQSLSLDIPHSSRTSVIKNLTSLRTGILALEDEQGRTDVVDGLRKQFGRLRELVEGVGMEDDVTGLCLPEDLEEEEEEESEGDKTPTMNHPPTGDLIGDGSGGFGHDEDATYGEVRIPIPQMPAGWGGSGKGAKSPPLPTRMELEQDEEDMRRQNQDVQLMQRVMMDDQDRSLDALSLAINRQRDLSLHISSELDQQEALLGDLDETMDSTASRLRRAGGRLDKVARKARENGAVCTIAGLIVILLLLILILK